MNIVYGTMVLKIEKYQTEVKGKSVCVHARVQAHACVSETSLTLLCIFLAQNVIKHIFGKTEELIWEIKSNKVICF